MKTKEQILSIKLNYSCVVKEQCGMRLGILVMNGRIGNKETPLKGTETSRDLFFNGDRNIDNDFLMIFGKEADLNSYLSTFTVTAIDLEKPTVVLFNGQELDLKTLNVFGLKANEQYSMQELTKNGASY